MIVDVVLLLVIVAYAFLAGAVLYGAGTSVVNAVRRRRLALAVEDQTPDHAMSNLADIFGGWMCTCGDGSWTTYGCTAATADEQRIIVGDYGRMAALPEALYEESKPTLGQERLYDAEGLVQYGHALIHRRCRDARRDFATDLICPACAKVFGTVTA